MATFYVLPPRPVLEDSLGRFLDRWLPGLPTVASPAPGFARWLQSQLDGRGDVFLVFREDVPDDIEIDESLRESFGAEPGDEVVEVRLAGAGELRAQARRVGEVSVNERISIIPSWTTSPLTAAHP